jgi:hypothetical protein
VLAVVDGKIECVGAGATLFVGVIEGVGAGGVIIVLMPVI